MIYYSITIYYYTKINIFVVPIIIIIIVQNKNLLRVVYTIHIYNNNILYSTSLDNINLYCHEHFFTFINLDF